MTQHYFEEEEFTTQFNGATRQTHRRTGEATLALGSRLCRPDRARIISGCVVHLYQQAHHR